jgi:hypothetical protein
MRFLDWLKHIGNPGHGLEQNTFLPLLTDSGDEGGALLIHAKETRNQLLDQFGQFGTEDGPAHGGAISSFLIDQISSSSGIVSATLQSGSLLQVVASPTISAGLRSGALSIMKSGGMLTGNVVTQSSKAIAAQLRFVPASAAPIMAPLIAWQILHAVAGVQQLARINARLDSLQRGIERLTFRQQAKTMGQLSAAIATLEDISEQSRASGAFTNDMLFRLALADRDIQASLAEQRFLVGRFDQVSSKILESSKGKAGAVSANSLLKEEAPEFMVDARILTAASKATLLSSQAWIRHDLEHNSANVPRRLRGLQSELANTKQNIYPLTRVQELDTYARECVEHMNWFDRNLFSRSLSKEVRGRHIPEQTREEVPRIQSVSSVLVWKGQDNKVRSVMVDAEIEKR